MRLAAVASIATLAICAGIAAPALADTQTATLGVTASLTDTCTLTGGTAALGSFVASPSAQQFADVDGGVTVTCNPGTAWALSADQGAHWVRCAYSAAVPQDSYTRQMGTGSNPCLSGGLGPNSDQLIGYDIYTDATFSTVLSKAGGGSYITGTGTGSTQAVPLNIEVGATLGAVGGDYADTVNLTLTYN